MPKIFELISVIKTKLRLLLKSLKPIRIIANIICFILGATITAIFGFLCDMFRSNIPTIIAIVLLFVICIIFFQDIMHSIPLNSNGTTAEKNTIRAAAIDGIVSFFAGIMFETVFIIASATPNLPYLPPSYCIATYILETIITGNIVFLLLQKRIAENAISLFCIFAYIAFLYLLSTKPLSFPILFFLLGFPLGRIRNKEETK